MEPPEPSDRLRSAGMIVLSLLVPMVAAGAVAQNAPLGNLAVALNTPLRRHVDGWSVSGPCHPVCIFNEGLANWQALSFASLLVALALTALRATHALG